jgi:hypothetical protein
VPSSTAPSAPVGVVSQGAQTTASMSSRTLSAPALGVVLGTGSAALLPLGAPTRSAPSDPIGPQPVPRYPSPNLLTSMGTASGSSGHGSPLDSLPPVIVVLAILAAAGMGLERRRRPTTRFDLRFSPPG